MSSKEAVRLVSSGLSTLFGINALIDTTYLPERLYSYVFYANRAKSPSATIGDVHFFGEDRVEVGLLLLRIGIYLLLAVAFWKCAPWVERLLTSENEQ
jgi:hypothetical protein